MKLLKNILQWTLGAIMVLAGVYHFLNAPFYLRMMPPILPAPIFLIYLSGALEIAFGVLLLIPKYTRFAAFGLIALFVAVFPANFYMWRNPQLFPEFTPTALLIRLPLQIVLIAWAFWFAKSEVE